MNESASIKNVKSTEVDSIPVIYRSTNAFGEIVAFNIVSHAGVAVTEKAGLIELMAKTLTSGTKSYSKEEIDKLFTETGAAFGIDAGSDYAEVSLKCLKKYLPKLLPVISEILRLPLFQPTEVELNRSQMIADLKHEQELPDAVLQLLAHEAFYKGHPYYYRPSGFLETIQTITREDLVKLLPKFFNRSNIFFTIVGDLSKEEIEKDIRTYFKGFPEGSRSHLVDIQPKNDTQKIAFKQMDAPTTYFLAKFKAPSLKDKDYPALMLATQILDNRLFEEVRTKRALTYAVSASLGSSNINIGYLYVSSTKLPEAVHVIFDEVKKMKDELIDKKTIEHQVRKFLSNWWLGREQASSQARIFAMYEIMGGGWKNSNGFIERLETVTPESIREVSRKYFRDYTIAEVGPEEAKFEIPKDSK